MMTTQTMPRETDTDAKLVEWEPDGRSRRLPSDRRAVSSARLLDHLQRHRQPDPQRRPRPGYVRGRVETTFRTPRAVAPPRLVVRHYPLPRRQRAPPDKAASRFTPPNHSKQFINRHRPNRRRHRKPSPGKKRPSSGARSNGFLTPTVNRSSCSIVNTNPSSASPPSWN